MNTTPLNRQEKRRIKTREQLEQAAIELLLEKGYETLTVQDITDRADLGRGTFYIYFKDKEDILWKIIEDAIIHRRDRAIFELKDGLPDQAAYYGYLNAFQLAEQHRDLYRVLLGGQGSAYLTAKTIKFMVEDTLEDISLFDLYPEIDLPTEIIAQIVIGAMIRLIVWWLDTPNSYSAADMAGMLYRELHHREAPQKIS